MLAATKKMERVYQTYYLNYTDAADFIRLNLQNPELLVLSDAESRLLFGNCKDVEAFSHTLWKSLKDAIRPVVNQASPDENSEVKYNEFYAALNPKPKYNDNQAAATPILMGSSGGLNKTTITEKYSDAFQVCQLHYYPNGQFQSSLNLD
jgi:hypothetical protein